MSKREEFSNSKEAERRHSEYGKILVGMNSKHYLDEGIIRADEKRKAGDLYGSIDMLNRTYKNLTEEANNLNNYDKLAYLSKIQQRTNRIILQAESSHREDVISSAKSLDNKVNKSGIEIGRRTPVRLKAIASVIALLGGLFFLSSNVTGNVIGNMTNSTSNWIGGILFSLGLVGALFYFRKK